MKNRSELIQRLGITSKTIENTRKEKEQMLKKGNPYRINQWVKETNGISINEMLDAIIKTGDILQIYEFFYMVVDIRNNYGNYSNLKELGISSEKLEKLEGAILESRNEKLIRYCIGFVPGIDLDKYLEVLYETNSYWDISQLSEGEEYINKDEVANPNLIESVKSDKYNNALEKSRGCAESEEYFPYSLKQYVDSRSNLNKLVKDVVNTKSSYLICELANYIEHIGIDERRKDEFLTELALRELETSDSMGIYEFLSSVKKIPQELFEKMVKKIIELGDKKYIEYTLEFTPYKKRMKDTLIERYLQQAKMKKLIEEKREGGR